MSLDHAFFYKSVNGDRVYDDTSFEHWLKKFFTSGVFLNDLQVTANEDMTVTVCAGYTNIDGKVKIFENATPLIIETAGASYPRIDSIVLERNDTERDILLKVVKGGYSSEPVAHTPVRQDGVYQLVIAQVLVNAGAVKVTQANITDTRSNTELCGIVAGAVEQIDFSQIQAQFDSYFAQYKNQIATDYTQYNADMETYLDQMAEDFSAWFEEIRNQLDEDAAGHLQNQIDDIHAILEYVGGSIVEVTVEAGEYNVEGLEVNLVIDGTTYTETINENIAKFTGVLEVGTAKINCVDETQEFYAETSIEIPYYGAYECSISGNYSYKDWIEAGGLNPSSYESLEALLEDEKAVRALITKKDAVEVLVNVKVGDLTTIINHPYVAKWVNYREYAYSTLSANPKIKILMDASGMYGMYITVDSEGEWQPKGLVPVMTSNTAPYGEALTNSTFSSNFNAYNVFNEGITNGWIPAAGVKNTYLAHRFVNPTIVKKYSVVFNKSNSPSDATIEFKASNNGVDWVTLDTFTTSHGTIEREIENNTPYLYYGIHSAAALTQEGVGNWEVKALQFYGRQLEALVPAMTSNTTPIGEASASSELSSKYGAFKAFDDTSENWCSTNQVLKNQWIQYKFTKPINVKSVDIKAAIHNSNARIKNFRVEASNNGSEFEVLYSGTTANSDKKQSFVFDNDKCYLYYRIFVIDTYVTTTDSAIGIIRLQFYGIPDYESRTYIYDNGVEVMEVGYEYANPATGYTKYNVEKQADSILFPAKGSKATVMLGLKDSPIDLTPYKMSGVFVSNGTQYGDIIGGIGVFTKKDATSENTVAKTGFVQGALPNPMALDLNSVNGYYYLVMNSGFETRSMEIYEWWLE